MVSVRSSDENNVHKSYQGQHLMLVDNMIQRNLQRYLSPAVVSFLERVVNIARRKTQESKGFFSSGTTVLDEVKFVLNKVPNYSPKSIRGLGSDIWKLLGEDYPNFDLKNCLSLSVANCFAAYNTLQSSEFVISIEEQDVLSFIHGCYAVACKQLCRDPQPLLEYEALTNNQQLIALCDRSILQNLVDFQTEHLSRVHPGPSNKPVAASATVGHEKSSEVSVGGGDDTHASEIVQAPKKEDDELNPNSESNESSVNQGMSHTENNNLLDDSNPFTRSLVEEENRNPPQASPYEIGINGGGSSSQHSAEVDQVRSYLQESGSGSRHSSSQPAAVVESQQMSDSHSNHDGQHEQRGNNNNNMIDFNSNVGSENNSFVDQNQNYAGPQPQQANDPSNGSVIDGYEKDNNNKEFEDFMSRYTESIRRDENIQNADRNSASDLQDTVGVRTFD